MSSHTVIFLNDNGNPYNLCVLYYKHCMELFFINAYNYIYLHTYTHTLLLIIPQVLTGFQLPCLLCIINKKTHIIHCAHTICFSQCWHPFQFGENQNNTIFCALSICCFFGFFPYFFFSFISFFYINSVHYPLLLKYLLPVPF